MSAAKVKRLGVTTPQGHARTLVHDDRYTFNYETSDRGCAVSLLLPVSSGHLAFGALLPIFSMNRPEGWLRERLQQRLKDQSLLNDMRMLYETGQHQIGRLQFLQAESLNVAAYCPLPLSEILDDEDTTILFVQLAVEYEMSGVSGVQPKVLLPVWVGGSGNETETPCEVIIKAGTDVYPTWPSTNSFVWKRHAVRVLKYPDSGCRTTVACLLLSDLTEWAEHLHLLVSKICRC
jgi:serine/threonine-protein kinase HipA